MDVTSFPISIGCFPFSKLANEIRVSVSSLLTLACFVYLSKWDKWQERREYCCCSSPWRSSSKEPLVFLSTKNEEELDELMFLWQPEGSRNGRRRRSYYSAVASAEGVACSFFIVRGDHLRRAAKRLCKSRKNGTGVSCPFYLDNVVEIVVLYKFISSSHLSRPHTERLRMRRRLFKKIRSTVKRTRRRRRRLSASIKIAKVRSAQEAADRMCFVYPLVVKVYLCQQALAACRFPFQKQTLHDNSFQKYMALVAKIY